MLQRAGGSLMKFLPLQSPRIRVFFALAACCGAQGAWACATPAVPAPPLHANGASLTLAWPAVESASRYRVWAQWRVPEGEVIRTLELVVNAPAIELPPSPQPWRPLTLQVEVSSQCAGNAASPVAVRHQLQYDRGTACPVVEGLEPLRNASPPAAWEQLRWKGRAGEHFSIAWFDGKNGRPLHETEVHGVQTAWPASVSTPALVRATRSCAEGRPSTAAYLWVP
jgi:hypothetical protein